MSRFHCECQRCDRHIALRSLCLCKHVGSVVQSGSAVGVSANGQINFLQRSILQLLLQLKFSSGKSLPGLIYLVDLQLVREDDNIIPRSILLVFLSVTV